MDEQSKLAVIEYYSELLEKHGPTPEAVVYRCPEQQITRYNLLADIEPLASHCSILDVGCGLGHFCDHLRKYGWKGRYTGIDINPDMISASRGRLPQEEFICSDILTEKFEQTYDYVFCGATVQIRPQYGDAQEYLEQMITKMFSLARRGLAFDVFSSRVDYHNEDNLYIDPQSLLDFCYSLTGRVVLRNDCRPYELMVYLYKEESVNDLNIYSTWMGPSPQIV